jgi:hypothetical protein
MTRHHRPARRAALLALVAAAASACGSTVQLHGALAPADLGGPLQPVTGTSSALAPTSLTPAGAADGLVSARSSGVPDAGGTAGVDVTGGVTGTTDVVSPTSPVEVGFFITKGVDKLFGSLGYADLSPGDQEAQVNAIVKVVNAEGGFAGHPIKPVFGIWDATKGNTVSQREAACAAWTQDHHVVAAVGESYETFRACSNKNHLPMLFGNPFPFTQEEMSTVPYMATPTVPLDERMHPAWVETLYAAGYFTPTGALPMKLGVVYADTPEQSRSVKKNLEPALKRRGIAVSSWGPLSMKSSQDLTASMQSTILRFRADGVTHVMLVDTGGIGLLFMPQAESQGFRPRYGMHSWGKPAQIQGEVPAAQLKNAVGGGWNPTVDVDGGYRPKDNAAALRCLKVMHDAGQQPDASLARESAFIYCDTTFTLKQMADRAHSLEPLRMMAALGTLGPSYQVSGSPYVDFTGRRDGPAGMRTFHFVDACTCFQYTTAPVRRF